MADVSKASVTLMSLVRLFLSLPVTFATDHVSAEKEDCADCLQSDLASLWKIADDLKNGCFQRKNSLDERYAGISDTLRDLQQQFSMMSMTCQLARMESKLAKDDVKGMTATQSNDGKAGGGVLARQVAELTASLGVLAAKMEVLEFNTTALSNALGEEQHSRAALNSELKQQGEMHAKQQQELQAALNLEKIQQKELYAALSAETKQEKEVQAALSEEVTQLRASLAAKRCESGYIDFRPHEQPKGTHLKRITFSTPFASVPVVAAGISQLDVFNGANTRLSTGVQRIDETGFDLYMGEWADSQTYSSTAVWMACAS